MRRHIAERFRNYSGGLSLDTEALKRYPDVIDLSIGDTDFTTDRRIIDAAYADACAGYTHYGDPKGDPELIAAIRRAWREDFGQELSEDEVLVTTSSCIGMSQALMGILNPGDEVITPRRLRGPAAGRWRSSPARRTRIAPMRRTSAGQSRPEPGR